MQCYSEIQCSVASKIATLQCNVARFMCKLQGANCNRFDIQVAGRPLKYFSMFIAKSKVNLFHKQSCSQQNTEFHCKINQRLKNYLP